MKVAGVEVECRVAEMALRGVFAVLLASLLLLLFLGVERIEILGKRLGDVQKSTPRKSNDRSGEQRNPSDVR